MGSFIVIFQFRVMELLGKAHLAGANACFYGFILIDRLAFAGRAFLLILALGVQSPATPCGWPKQLIS
jgi:hypothetical protein